MRVISLSSKGHWSLIQAPSLRDRKVMSPSFGPYDPLSLRFSLRRGQFSAIA